MIFERKHSWNELDLATIFILYLIVTFPYQIFLIIKENRRKEIKEKFCGCLLYKEKPFRYCDYHRMYLGEIK